LSLVWAALSVAMLHTLLPVHWLPYVTVARSNGWNVVRLLGLTLAGTLVHLLSTTALTAIALLLSYGASHTVGHTMERAGAGVMVVLAMFYLLLPAKVKRWSDRMTWFLAVGVGIQPCIELVPLVLVAAISGPAATALVGATWAVTTILLSLALVLCAYWGITLGWTRWFARYAYVITGLVLGLSAAGLFFHAH
jgi:nickel/cobalt exporter